MTRPGKLSSQARFKLRIFRSRGGHLNLPSRANHHWLAVLTGRGESWRRWSQPSAGRRRPVCEPPWPGTRCWRRWTRPAYTTFPSPRYWRTRNLSEHKTLGCLFSFRGGFCLFHWLVGWLAVVVVVSLHVCHSGCKVDQQCQIGWSDHRSKSPS